MGFFNWFGKKKRQKISLEELENSGFQSETYIRQRPDKSISYVIDRCEQMAESKRQIRDIKTEYTAVSQYLADIQKIDLMPPMERDNLEIAARNILTYTKEREKYTTKDAKLTDSQRNNLERHEGDLVRDLKRMKENESYSGVVKSDMGYLEGEKRALFHERKEIVKRQAFLKQLSVGMSVVVISLFVLIVLLLVAFEANLAIPFILTIIMAAGSATYIYLEANRNRKDMNLAERKLDKAIGLLNKVKIKYINNQSLFEYTCEKYGVNSSDELDYIWKQYIIVVENERKYQQNTERLAENKRRLIDALEDIGVADTEIWTHQTNAILEKREMVEVRHNLNVRRQKLRDNLDYNTKAYNQNQTEIEGFIKQNPEMRDEVMSILRNYHIEL